MEYKDYYEIMGVARDATQQEIKLAYRKLGRKYHPDVSKETDAEAQFKLIGEAYEVLKDPEKRAAYDQLGREWKSGQDFRPPPDWDSGFEFRGGGYTAGDAGAYSDFFEELFGHEFGQASHTGRRRTSRMRGEDHHAKVFINLEDSVNGAIRPVSLRMPTLTDDGHVISRERTLNIRIPKGIRAGQQIRLAGQGEPGQEGAESGDLYLEIAFHEHPVYRIHGGDIYLDLPVAPWEAALGATVTVPVPSGHIELTIPANSKQGKKLRLKDRGLPGKQPGDFYVVVQIALPPADSDEAKALYKKMKEQLGFDPRATMRRV